jgi:sec-independent protein translocase protein TatA
MCNLVLLFLNFSAGEIGLILFVALLLFGGDKFPEIARGLAKGIREFKSMSDGVKRELNDQINNFDQPRAPIAQASIEPQPVIDPEVNVEHHTTEGPHNAITAGEHQPLAPVELPHIETVINPTHETIDTPVFHEVKQEHTL